MPTKYPRIQVTADPELAAAVRRARERRPGVPASRLIRDLALRGDAAADEEHSRSEADRAAAEAKHRAALEDLVRLTTTPGLLDHDALREARASWMRHAHDS